MIKFLIDLLQFLYSTIPLITCIVIFTLLAIWLSKSIKKHAKIYYAVLAIPSLMFAIPFICRWFGLEIFSFSRIPFLGGILRDYMHMATFGFPLLIVIMYMGALDMKIPFVKKLMNIRKELSIISGFPVLCHSLVRVVNTFPGSFRYFFDHEDYMANKAVVSGFGAFLTNFSYFLGIFMVVLFLILWITSFDSVHKRLGGAKWKKVQKWSYVLYAMLFLHSTGLAFGGLLNPRGGGNPQKAKIENAQTIVAQNNVDTLSNKLQGNLQREKKAGENGDPETGKRAERNIESQSAEQNRRGHKNKSEEKIGGENNRGDANTHNSVLQSDKERKEKGGRNRNTETQETSAKNNTGTSTFTAEQSNKETNVQAEGKQNENRTEVANAKRSGRAQSIGFSDIEISSTTKRYIHIISLFLIFGSYLFLRLQKAKKKGAKKKSTYTN